ncbi:MAG: VCBS domain-containing protein [Hyphomicrobiales bacterium]
MARKKRFKLAGDNNGDLIEDLMLEDLGTLTVKKLKGKPKVSDKFLSTDDDDGTPVGTFDTSGKKKIQWTYKLDNDDPRVQALAAGEFIVEKYQIRVKAKGYKTVKKTVTVTIDGADLDVNPGSQKVPGLNIASRDQDNVQVNSPSTDGSISYDGRFVVYRNAENGIVDGDTNNFSDFFLKDMVTGKLTLVSQGSAGESANAASIDAMISANGLFVAFQSLANNIGSGESGGDMDSDIFVRDIANGTTELISINSAGTGAANDLSQDPSISADGNFVAFESNATDLAPEDTTGGTDIYVRDRDAGTTQLVSISTGGIQGNNVSFNPAISADGRYVAFESLASDLVITDAGGHADIFVRDLVTGTTELVSLSSAGVQANSDSNNPSISADGRYIAFESIADNLLGLGVDTNLSRDIFVYDSVLDTTIRVSVASNGDAAIGDSFNPVISADGRYVTFSSVAENLAPGNDHGVEDQVFVHDILTGTTTRLSNVGGDGGPLASLLPMISGDGRFVAFESVFGAFTPEDQNVDTDIFVASTTDPLGSAVIDQRQVDLDVDSEFAGVADLEVDWGDSTVQTHELMAGVDLTASPMFTTSISPAP